MVTFALAGGTLRNSVSLNINNVVTNMHFNAFFIEMLGGVIDYISNPTPEEPPIFVDSAPTPIESIRIADR